MSAGENEGEEWHGDTAPPHTWAHFDALPLGVKRFYWFAPYNYTAYPTVKAWRAGADMRAEVASLIERSCIAVARESRILYGQAQDGWL